MKDSSLIVIFLSGEGMFLCIGALLNLLVLDNLVNGTLYHYGLQFSYDWANDYWFSMRLVLFQIALVVIFLMLLLIVVIKRREGGG